MPCIDSTDETYTIIDWYFQWKGRTDFDEVKHDFRISNFIYKSVNISYGNLPYLLIKDYLTYFRLLSWFIKYLVFSLLDLFRGKWWSLLLIYELLLAKSASFCSKTMLAEDYMFHYSGLIYRPLWTYVVEDKGSRVLTYFYSSYQPPSVNSTDTTNSELWPASTWSHHLVWDSYQKKYLEQNLKNNSKIEVVKSIWFFDTNKNLNVPEKSIAVFPIEFAKLQHYMPISSYGELIHEHPDYFELFINDILSVITRNGYTMVLKLKRDRPKDERSQNTLEFIDKIKNNSNIIVADSFISPVKLFQKCKAVISMPFTSTSHYTEIKSPNIYYDPIGWFDPNDSAAHGIPVITKQLQLQQWLSSEVIK